MITSDTGRSIYMELKNYDIEPSTGSDCTNDYVIVYDSQGVVKKICNKEFDFDRIFHDVKQLRIYFHSNKQNQFNGFEAVFYAYGE